jgi:hypothetical protein
MQSHSARGDHQRRAQGDGRGETLNHVEQIASVTARPYLLAVNLAAVGGALLLEQNNEGSERLSRIGMRLVLRHAGDDAELGLDGADGVTR